MEKKGRDHPLPPPPVWNSQCKIDILSQKEFISQINCFICNVCNIWLTIIQEILYVDKYSRTLSQSCKLLKNINRSYLFEKQLNYSVCKVFVEIDVFMNISTISFKFYKQIYNEMNHIYP